MAGRRYKKLMESLKTIRKPLDLEDINTLFLEALHGMDPLKEDQLGEELMMEECRDEEEEAVPHEPKPSSSTVNMATTDADHVHSLPTKHRCTRHRNAPDRWSPDRLTMQPPQSYSIGGQHSSGQLTGKPIGTRAALGQLGLAPWELPSTVSNRIAWIRTGDLQAIGRILHSFPYPCFTSCIIRGIQGLQIFQSLLIAHSCITVHMSQPASDCRSLQRSWLTRAFTGTVLQLKSSIVVILQSRHSPPPGCKQTPFELLAASPSTLPSQ
ncbi:UNVERIFIED_CONTAM: hypothetical protein FKN15_064710 [Acipenser sinensis]